MPQNANQLDHSVCVILRANVSNVRRSGQIDTVEEIEEEGLYDIRFAFGYLLAAVDLDHERDSSTDGQLMSDQLRLRWQKRSVW